MGIECWYGVVVWITANETFWIVSKYNTCISLA